MTALEADPAAGALLPGSASAGAQDLRAPRQVHACHSWNLHQEASTDGVPSEPLFACEVCGVVYQHPPLVRQEPSDLNRPRLRTPN